MGLKDKNNKFDRKRLINSFKYAFDGIIPAYDGEQNLKIHSLFVVIVIVFGFLLKISMMEWFICMILFGMVISLELVNTSIEYLVDIATDKYSDIAKKALDISALAVFVNALISFIIGLIIFVPKLIIYINNIL